MMSCSCPVINSTKSNPTSHIQTHDWTIFKIHCTNSLKHECGENSQVLSIIFDHYNENNIKGKTHNKRNGGNKADGHHIIINASISIYGSHLWTLLKNKDNVANSFSGYLANHSGKELKEGHNLLLSYGLNFSTR